jgi:hypothetical protein
MIWLAWFLVAVVSFAIFEGYALRTGRIKTLSRTVYDMNQAWPLTSAVIALVMGALLTHFFWHWCPPGSIQGG